LVQAEMPALASAKKTRGGSWPVLEANRTLLEESVKGQNVRFNQRWQDGQ
jgi:hypothetical protein